MRRLLPRSPVSAQGKSSNPQKMMISCELYVRPESVKRIEDKLCSISEDEDVLSFSIKNEK